MEIAFVCVQNAGRSQMATAFAEEERQSRGLDDVELTTGGTRPAASVHEVVVQVMAETGTDISDRVPREISVEELQATDVVVTMGCSAEDVCPATWSGENRDWDLPDPEGKSVDAVRDIRDEIHTRVVELFEELQADTPKSP